MNEPPVYDRHLIGVFAECLGDALMLKLHSGAEEKIDANQARQALRDAEQQVSKRLGWRRSSCRSEPPSNWKPLIPRLSMPDEKPTG